MESEIWRVRSEKIGTLETFKSEFDMESFLMNNPAIIGCWNPDEEALNPMLIRQQLHTKKGTGSWGRIDLVGININDDNDYELRIFELKQTKIDIAAVEQLDSYLKGWEHEKSAKSDIKKWLVGLELNGVDNNSIDKIIDKPHGVLVGPEFDLDATIKARNCGFKEIRLTRFRAESKSEYYVIVEDVIGDVVQSAKRQQYDWNLFVDKGLIETSDIFTIRNEKKGIEINAQLDPNCFGTRTTKFVFDDTSITKILDRTEEIKKNVAELKWRSKQDLEAILQAIKNKKGILITHATGIVYFAFKWPTSFWVPGQYWFHQKTKKTLNQLRSELGNI
jgi:hypothetical protein